MISNWLASISPCSWRRWWDSSPQLLLRGCSSSTLHGTTALIDCLTRHFNDSASRDSDGLHSERGEVRVREGGKRKGKHASQSISVKKRWGLPRHNDRFHSYLEIGLSRRATNWKNGSQTSASRGPPVPSLVVLGSSQWLIFFRLTSRKSLQTIFSDHVDADITDVTVGPLPTSKTRPPLSCPSPVSESRWASKETN